jgi:hypothetical protein
MWTNGTIDYGTSSSQIVWQTWATTATDSTTITNVVWDAWSGMSVYNTGYYTQAAPLTEEQIEANRVRAEAAQAAAAERRVLEAAAKERARKLLLEALADDQQAELLKDGFFHVETRDGTRRYRLSPTGQPKRVRGEDGLAWAYCIHPEYGYPQDDVVLAQKLMLEADEEAFLRIANARQVSLV